jgi:hypothetical protein
MRFERFKGIASFIVLFAGLSGFAWLVGSRLIGALNTGQVEGRKRRLYTFADQPFAAWFETAELIVLLVFCLVGLAGLIWLAFLALRGDRELPRRRAAAPLDVSRRGPATAGRVDDGPSPPSN